MKKISAKPKLFSVTFVILVAANFVSALNYYLLAVKIVEYAIQLYGVSYGVAGLMISSYVISAMASRIVFGKAIDDWGYKKSIVMGFVISAFSSALYFFDMGFVQLVAARALHGVGFAISSGALAAAAALVVPQERKGEGIGYFTMSQTLATGIGPLVAIALVGSGNAFVPLFTCLLAANLVTLAGSMFLSLPESVVVSDPAPQKGFSLGKYVHVRLFPLAFTMFFVTFCYSNVVSFLASFATERSLVEAASLYFAVYSVASLSVRPYFGKRFDRKGENSVIYLTLSILLTAFVLLAFSLNGFMLLCSAALMGIGFGATQSTIQTVIAKTADPSEQGKANSANFICMDFGNGVGPVLIGSFIPLLGYQACFLSLAVVCLITCGYYYLVHGSKVRR